jgi:hypothetical protein
MQLAMYRKHRLVGFFLATGIPILILWIGSLRQYYSELNNGWEIIGATFDTFVIIATGLFSWFLCFAIFKQNRKRI